MVYSLFYSIRELRRVQLPFLANVLLFFSCIVPYGKLVLMLVGWLAPSKLLPRRYRRLLLLFVDQVGKYSLVDIFVVQFISGALCTSFELGTPTRPDGTPAQPLSVVLRTSSGVGFLSFVIATVGSLVIGHVCLFFHENDLHLRPEPAEATASEAAAPEGQPAGLCWPLLLRDAAVTLTGRRWRRVGPLLLLTSALIVAGCAQTAFAVSLVSPQFGTFSRTSYSMFDLMLALPSFTENPNDFVTRFSQVTYVLFV